MFRRRPRLSFVLFATFTLLAIYFSAVARASIFGTVRGIVHDTQHRPIEGATIELRAKLSDWRHSAVSDSEGGFQIDAQGVDDRESACQTRCDAPHTRAHRPLRAAPAQR